MNKLIENTLDIISRINPGRCGYLLEINSTRFKVLKIWGAPEKDFDLVNDYLFNQHLAGGINCNTVQLSGLFLNNSYGSHFIKEIINDKQRKLAIYILLFSTSENQFSEEFEKNINSIIPLLNNQVKQFFIRNDQNNPETHTVPGKESELLLAVNGLPENWEENFVRLIEITRDVIFILDKAGKFILINKAGEDLLEYPLSNIKGKHFCEFVDQEDSAKINELLKDALLKDEVVNFKVSLITNYEKAIPLEMSCKVIRKEEEVLGLFGTAHNVIELKTYELELKKLKPKILEAHRLLKLERSRLLQKRSLIDELNRLKQEFVSNISHEFRTPLASIIGFSETIESDPDLPPEMKKEFNKVILNEGKRLAKLINSILNLSKYEREGIALVKSNFDAIALIREAAEVNSDFAKHKNIEMNIETFVDKIMIEADKEHLFRAINALLNNAIKFTNDFGRVKIIINNLFREIEIIISDTGIGIPDKDLPYIFQRFYRASRPGADVPGTGVGLVFVKQVVDLHKGLITVQSDIDNGTTFMVKLPKTSKIEKN